MRRLAIRPLSRCVWLAALALLLVPHGAAAQEDDVYYHHVDPNYWWYLSQNPSFELAVTSQGRRYITHDVLGEREVTIDYALGGPLFKVGGLRLGGRSAESVRRAVLERYLHLFQQPVVQADNEITTSNNLKARFYAVTGRTPDGKTGMLRFVFFEGAGQVAWLIFLGDEASYSGDYRVYWLQAVNTFTWR